MQAIERKDLLVVWDKEEAVAFLTTEGVQLTEEEFLVAADFVIQNPNLPADEQRERLTAQVGPRLKEKLESIGALCYNK